MDPNLPGLVVYFDFNTGYPTLLERLAGTGVPTIYDELTTRGERRPKSYLPPGVLVGPCPWGLVHRQDHAILIVSGDEAHITGDRRQ